MLGDTIRIFRLERGMTADELGESVEVGKTAIEQYEANIWQPGLPTLKKIAQVFGVTVDALRRGLSLVYDTDGHSFMVVQNMNENQMKIIGRVHEKPLSEGSGWI